MSATTELKHRDLTERIIGVYYQVYNELGCGFLESVYEEALAVALEEARLQFRRQAPLPVWFRGRQVGDFKADYIIDDLILVELKAAKVITESHEAQLLNYLSATALEVGRSTSAHAPGSGDWCSAYSAVSSPVLSPTGSLS